MGKLGVKNYLLSKVKHGHDDKLFSMDNGHEKYPQFFVSITEFIPTNHFLHLRLSKLLFISLLMLNAERVWCTRTLLLL